jgi:hypothetical protein
MLAYPDGDDYRGSNSDSFFFLTNGFYFVDYQKIEN